MKIGILETGRLNEQLMHNYPSYPQMFATLLNRAQENLSYRNYSVIDGEMPASVRDCDGWLITGSRHGVYENLPWMSSLTVLIRTLYQQKIPLVGICFGHQIIAQALGGEVVQSAKGWGLGLQSYRIDMPQPWLDSAKAELKIYAFHQDQVVTLPPQAMVFLSSDFCSYAGLCYGDSIISIQAHPEFDVEYERALLSVYAGNLLDTAVAKTTLQQVEDSEGSVDTQLLAESISRFFVCNKP